MLPGPADLLTSKLATYKLPDASAVIPSGYAVPVGNVANAGEGPRFHALLAVTIPIRSTAVSTRINCENRMAIPSLSSESRIPGADCGPHGRRRWADIVR